MKKKITDQRCQCKRAKVTWLCTFPNCKDFLFCKKCRKNHNRRHEEYFYPLRELMEEDLEDSIEPFEFNDEEKEKLRRRLQDQINKVHDDFDEKMKRIVRKQRRYIEDFNTASTSRNMSNQLEEYRRRVQDDPRDMDALKKLGREYHRYLQDSNVQNVDRHKTYQKFRDDMVKNFDFFLRDLGQIMDHLEGKEAYPEESIRRRSRSIEKNDNLVESEVRNSTIPKEWEREDPTEDVNRSLHIIRQNKEKQKYREE